MPITAYTGLPGHGKSYGVVEHVILPALRAGRMVVTNLALRADVVAAEYPEAKLFPFDVAAICAEPGLIKAAALPGAVVVIDEAWRLWPQGMQGKNVPEPFRAFLAEHRHNVDADGNSMQVVLVTQDLKQLASFARALIEETYRVRKLVALGASKSFVVDVYAGAAVSAVSGGSPPEKGRVRQMPGRYKAEVWRFYQSHTKREGEGSGANEAKLDRRGVLWRSPVFYLGAPAVFGALCIGVWKTWDFFHAEVGEVKASTADVRSVVSAIARPDQVASVGHRWRITGSIPELDWVYVSDGSGYVRLSIDRDCDSFIEGFLICRWDGQEISNQVREYPSIPRGASLELFGTKVVSSSEAR